jgi:hypothetical protein
MKSTVVRIWGLAIDGKIFHQNATFRSLSRTGAQLEGVLREVQVRETIAVQYEQKRARVVVSSVDSRDLNNIILGVALVADAECPWEALLDGPKTENTGDNRRKYKRHSVELPVELRDKHSEISVRVLATDVCGNGCYLQTMATAPVKSVFVASFWYRDMRITCGCTVRTSDPGLGMGIEFTGLDRNARAQLQNWLEVQDVCQSTAANA